MSRSEPVAHPTPDEVAAIVAAAEVAWPRPPAPDDAAPAAPVTPAWRFSGRWWRAPVASRRDRPS